MSDRQFGETVEQWAHREIKSLDRGPTMCDACWKEQHYLCGMQTWCECPCDGSPTWGIGDIDTDYASTPHPSAYYDNEDK